MMSDSLKSSHFGWIQNKEIQDHDSSQEIMLRTLDGEECKQSNP